MESVLAALESVLRQRHPLLLRSLGPGLTDEQIRQLESSIELRLPTEVRRLYAWKNGLECSGPTCPEILPGYVLLPLQEAVEIYRELVKSATALAEQLSLAADAIWSVWWFPFLKGYGTDFIVVCLPDDANQHAALWAVDMENPEGRRELFSGLTEMLSAVTDGFQHAKYVADGSSGCVQATDQYRQADDSTLDPSDMALVECLKSADGRARGAAAQAIMDRNDARFVAALNALLKYSNPSTRELSVRILGHLGDKTAGDRVVPLLRDSNAGVRAAAAETLGYLGSAGFAAALRDAVHDRDFNVKRKAIWAMGEIGQREDIAMLEAIAGNAALQNLAADAIFRIRSRAKGTSK